MIAQELEIGKDLPAGDPRKAATEETVRSIADSPVACTQVLAPLLFRTTK